jgi:hypothetical protein
MVEAQPRKPLILMPYLYTATKPMNTNTLPRNIAKDLSELELKHKLHKMKMEEQHEAKHEARKHHREGWHKRKIAPIHLTYP